DHCGEEIQIVPDFEPEIETEIENSITETLSALASIQGEKTADHETQSEAEKTSEQAVSLAAVKKWRPQIILGLAILFVAALISYALYSYHIHTVDYQISKAKAYAESGAYNQAITCLEAAYKDHPDVAGILFLEADYYYLQQMDAYALSSLMRIIDNEQTAPYSEADVEEAYGKIVTIYANQEAYRQINDLLLGCDKERVEAVFRAIWQWSRNSAMSREITRK
ncbi:MAG: hypothetical protein K2M22_12525, partial [Lachnospiraceae bacterium]|nr:hypothetical protein [Lachnospiraceae bacterium]